MVATRIELGLTFGTFPEIIVVSAWGHTRWVSTATCGCGRLCVSLDALDYRGDPLLGSCWLASQSGVLQV
jgi:hypothetical protein